MEFNDQYLTYQEYADLGGTLEETPFNLLSTTLAIKGFSTVILYFLFGPSIFKAILIDSSMPVI